MLSPFDQRKKILRNSELQVSERHRRFVLRAMASVLAEGTLKKLRIRNRRIKLWGAKSGTATHFRKKFSSHGWNIVLLSHANIRYVLVSFVTRGSGAGNAATQSKIVLEAL